ncbi:MAG: hypothetical protein E7232_15200 [Lachnospiraceae bacterium]|jgi:hypothetical protein|nr:hypothetical protein [Lachnospiraceae bacterium]
MNPKRISIYILTLFVLMTMISPAYAAYIQNVDGTWFWYEGFDDDTDEIDPSLYQYSGTYWDESFQKLLILQLKDEININNSVYKKGIRSISPSP